MRQLKQSFRLIAPPTRSELYKKIEIAGRTCYKSEDKITDTSAEPFVRGLIKRGHTAMIEHASLTIVAVTDRGVSHEIVRHRLASYAQESSRYVNYSLGKNDSQIKVIDIRNGIKNDPKTSALPKEEIDYIVEVWEQAMADAEAAYMEMTAHGASPNIARSVLPNSTKTEIVITMNLREWRHFCSLRADKAAHPQMRELASGIYKLLNARYPAVFDDLAGNFPDIDEICNAEAGEDILLD